MHDFLPKLVDHLLTCLLPNTDITEEHRGQLIIRDHMIYEHKTLRVNYTTYDNRREQDTINPNRQSDVMFLANEDGEDAHPYWYFRIVKIFHTMVRLNHPGQQFQRVEFLWGRWYGFDYEAKSGFVAKRMHQIGFMEGSDAFDFVNPRDVLRAVHLIPRFAGPRIGDLLGPSMARREDEDDLDYERYYVDMFVDRDMFVRFTGGGIGHRSIRDATCSLLRETERAFSNRDDLSADDDMADEAPDDPAQDSEGDQGEEVPENPGSSSEELSDEDVGLEEGDDFFDESLGFADM
ncbi:hypothetical protein DXG01_008413 [Tephrocybe rancida]|nr:hypothetical protein DXG01_008413 [Tephrocybe rancida]